MVRTFEALLSDATEAFSTISSTPRLDAELLLSYIIRKERSWLLIHAREEAKSETISAFSALVQRRAQGEPVAYLVGEREFMGLSFSVESGILIPRPDTETLVEAVLCESLPDAPSILDLCTGSGAIAVSLAHFLPKARVTAVDVSPLCVKTAQKNAEKNGVGNRVCAIYGDILSEDFPDESFLPVHVLVSNPPYIKSSDLYDLMTDVKDFEPHLALDGGEDGLLFYRRIARLIPQLVVSGGLVALEVGHDQAESVKKILEENSACETPRFACDLAGIKRVVLARVK